MNWTDEFLGGLEALRRAEMTPRLRHQVKRCLLDYLGATLAGSRMVKGKVAELLDVSGSHAGDAMVIGLNRRADCAMAAFANGLSSHAAELDDGVISGIVHPGAPIFSALLPSAEKEGVSGTDLLRGALVGYEAATRLADAIQPSHKARGFHASSTCGSVGAAVGLAAMLELPKSVVKDVFSSAAVAAAGSLKVLEDKSQLKPFNVGRAAVTGVLAMAMGRAGFEGPEDVLSGKAGFFSMMTDEVETEYLRVPGTGRLAVERVYVKPYAACRYCHGGIDAALAIRERHNVVPERVRSVEVATYRWAVAKHDHTAVDNVSSAKMSIPFSVAVALARGSAGINQFSMENIGDPLVASLTQKVKVREDRALTELFPEKTVSVVVLTTEDGAQHVERVERPRGEPETALSDAELEEKALELAIYAGKSEDTSRQMVEAVWKVDDDLPSLLGLL